VPLEMLGATTRCEMTSDRTLPPVRETDWIAVDAGWEWDASIKWVGDVAEPIWSTTASQSQVSMSAPSQPLRI
jgi:hypothetical protein